MAKAMTEKRRQKWSTLRIHGWVWFVFVWGLLRYGLPWGTLMFIASHVHLFGMQSRPLRTELPALAIASAFFGIAMAATHWRLEERRFQEDGASGTSSV
jgi:hypothetical protein